MSDLEATAQRPCSCTTAPDPDIVYCPRCGFPVGSAGAHRWMKVWLAILACLVFTLAYQTALVRSGSTQEPSAIAGMTARPSLAVNQWHSASYLVLSEKQSPDKLERLLTGTFASGHAMVVRLGADRYMLVAEGTNSVLPKIRTKLPRTTQILADFQSTRMETWDGAPSSGRYIEIQIEYFDSSAPNRILDAHRILSAGSDDVRLIAIDTSAGSGQVDMGIFSSTPLEEARLRQAFGPCVVSHSYAFSRLR